MPLLLTREEVDEYFKLHQKIADHLVRLELTHYAGECAAPLLTFGHDGASFQMPHCGHTAPTAALFAEATPAVVDAVRAYTEAQQQAQGAASSAKRVRGYQEHADGPADHDRLQRLIDMHAAGEAEARSAIACWKLPDALPDSTLAFPVDRSRQ